MRPLIAVALALTATGCTLIQQPTLAFKNARALDTDLEGTTLQVTYALKNPNPIGLSLASVSYDLEVEGHKVISGKPPNGLRVAAQGSTDLTFPARVRFQELVPVLMTFLSKDQASYRASGTVGIQTPIGPIQLPLSYSGVFPIPKVPALAFQQPRLQGLSFTGVRVVFPIQVSNKNVFPLPLGGLSANVNIAGAQVGMAQASLPQNLAANQAQVVEVPVEVNFLQVGFAVANAIKSGQAPVKFEGAFQCGNLRIPISMSETLRFK